MNAPARHWPLPHTHNIRDLGGYALAGGGQTPWARLLRSDDLSHLTPESHQALVTRGLQTVIDLRSPREIAVRPGPFSAVPGVRYHNISVFDGLAPLATVPPSVSMGERYCRAADQCAAPLAQVFTTLAHAQPGLTLFHCTAGKDRTGIVAALLLAHAGVHRDEIIEDYALTGVIAAAMLERLRAHAISLGSDAAQAETLLSSAAVHMARFLDHLDQNYGGASGYLAKIGLSEQDRWDLRTRVTGAA